MKPYSEACERNKGPILEVLREAFADRRKVLEIGSGTGQHALHFAQSLPHLSWQPSDVPANLPGLRAQFQGVDVPNLCTPIALDLDEDWAALGCDALFSANTADDSRIGQWCGLSGAWRTPCCLRRPLR